MICPNCGAPLPDTAKMCHVCRTRFINGEGKTAQQGASVSPQYNGSIDFNYNNTPSGLTYDNHSVNNRLPLSQPRQLNVTNPNWDKPVKKDNSWKVLSIVIAVMAISAVFIFVLVLGSGDDDKTIETRTTESRKITEYEDIKTTAEEVTEALTEKETNSIPVASDFSNMKIGEICCVGDVYAGLTYAKISESFISALGNQEDIASDKQVLYAIFDVYNSGYDKVYVDNNSFSCYVDGINYSKVDTYFEYSVDEISSDLSEALYDNTCKMVLTNFEIPKEWNEIKLYYGSDCIWNLTQSDISEEPFGNTSLYDVDYIRTATSEGDMVYSDDYELVFDGYEYYTAGYSNENYLIVKFTINNTGNTELDYSLVGYDMSCYKDNYVTESASYFIDDKIGDYLNIFDVDSIQAGMSAKVYLAFKTNEEHGFYRVVYDTGYISEEYLTDVYIDTRDTASNNEPD